MSLIVRETISATYLRPLRMDDLDNILEWVNDFDVRKNFADFTGKKTREEEKEYVVRMISSKNDRVYSVENEQHAYIGQVGLHQIYWPAKNARIAITIGKKDEWGKGHAQRAARQLLGIAFKALELNKVWAIHYKENVRMHHILEKVGFQTEGILEEEYCSSDGYHDMVRMAILKRRWNDK